MTRRPGISDAGFVGRTNRIRPLCAAGGFTLIELWVAVGIMALMAGLSWRSLDGMTKAQAQVQQRTDSVLEIGRAHV